MVAISVLYNCCIIAHLQRAQKSLSCVNADVFILSQLTVGYINDAEVTVKSSLRRLDVFIVLHCESVLIFPKLLLTLHETTQISLHDVPLRPSPQFFQQKP